MPGQGGFGQVGFGDTVQNLNTINAETAQTIIQAAYRKILIPNPTTTQLNNGLGTLNNLLASLFTQRLLVYEVVHEEYTLTINQAQYAIGPGADDFDSPRPTKVVSAYVRDPADNIDYKNWISVLKTYEELTVKDNPGIPQNLVYVQEYPNGQILLDTLPDKAYILVMDTWKPLFYASDLSTVIAMPMEYNRALVYNMAVEMAPEVNMRVPPEVAGIAAQALDWITHVNGSACPEAVYDSVLLRTTRYNIFTDQEK